MVRRGLDDPIAIDDELEVSVLDSIATAPSRSPCRAPRSGSVHTVCEAWSSRTIEMTTSAVAAASRGLAAIRAPASATGAARSGAVLASVRGRLATNNSDALLTLARAGLGIAVLADWLVRDALDAGELVSLLGPRRSRP